MIGRIGGTGIALENNCAMEFMENRFYRVIASKPYSRAYVVHRIGGNVIAEQIPKQEELAPAITQQSQRELRWRSSGRITGYSEVVPHRALDRPISSPRMTREERRTVYSQAPT